jgi:hypothetical protein
MLWNISRKKSQPKKVTSKLSRGTILIRELKVTLYISIASSRTNSIFIRYLGQDRVGNLHDLSLGSAYLFSPKMFFAPKKLIDLAFTLPCNFLITTLYYILVRQLVKRHVSTMIIIQFNCLTQTRLKITSFLTQATCIHDNIKLYRAIVDACCLSFLKIMIKLGEIHNF